jgi:branched-chain amino acid transport system permease protein
MAVSFRFTASFYRKGGKYMSIEQFSQYVIGGLTSGSIYALIAVGFILIFNVSKVINFAQGEFVMFGAMGTIFFIQWFSFPIVISAIAAVICVAILSMLLYILFIEGYKSEHLNIALITLGGSMMFTGLSGVIFGKNPSTLPPFITGSVKVFGATYAYQALIVLSVSVLLIVLLSLYIKKTKLGKLMKAASQNDELLKLSGVNPKLIYRLSFAFSGLIGGIGGIVIAPITFASYNMGGNIGLMGLIAAIFGGLNSYFGGLAGGLALGLIESLSAGVISSEAKGSIAFGILIIILIFRPNGLLGGKGN